MAKPDVGSSFKKYSKVKSFSASVNNAMTPNPIHAALMVHPKTSLLSTLESIYRAHYRDTP
jgi:hypothetical protein